ncbi:restriction endonuclease [Erythrobacter aureus]|uniref:Restriction endonuclease n=1 Tax=Erythrobacter aureus TaxID=2182384 RepID=A0A345YJA6_9SPHN|nr:restriction endonuclease [Erythrobacter aureus]AXK44008.1 restriction endonuclease [Erythrobacter aureus]
MNSQPSPDLLFLAIQAFTSQFNIFVLAISFVTIIGALATLYVVVGQKREKPNPYHKKMRAQAAAALKRLKRIGLDNPGAVINYIRKMNPHAVEELVLDAAEAAGHKVKRNRAYTGDGGVDGQICIDDMWYLVQTKRYSKAITPEHVAAFSCLCRQRGKPGLFIHTGRTGPKSRLRGSPVTIISGSSLTSLIAGQPIEIELPRLAA